MFGNSLSDKSSTATIVALFFFSLDFFVEEAVLKAALKLRVLGEWSVKKKVVVTSQILKELSEKIFVLNLKLHCRSPECVFY